MTRSIVIFASLMIIASCETLQQKGEFIEYYRVETQKPYDDVLAEIKIAIAEHNLRITAHSRIGKVIRDRGTANFPDYDTIQFCNLTHAETLLTLSPHSVSHMPCNVVLYAFEGKTIVSTHLLPTDTGNPELDAFSVKMNGMLKLIVDFAVEE
ncbi:MULTISPECIES: DUF302 domain-containing protein [Methylotuvimicrobium]|uniref:Lipoprotein n=2 Tax=Methylotuvimicrobium TaxID=2822410 RepID=G4T2D5_META2|nr:MULTISPECIES: DUF302 domain-containing protein [Methylotuvimicrobium]QCW82791.1 DUF302 domain-containing protein [Methylotuvimicrobium buryatense]CCE23575.1 putative lipoprotein [Methylotuvimicrobium alcaliphilum 20Z]